MEEQVAKKPESRKKRTLTVFAVLMGLVLAVYLLLFQVNRFSLEMQLLGDAHTVLEYGSVYEESGVQLSLKGSVFFREGMLPEDAVLETMGSVDTDKLGTYVLTYRGVYRGQEVTAQRTVTVVDTQAPVISLVSAAGEITEEDMPYIEEGFSAKDNYDGDITRLVERQECYGMIVYTVTDSSGNKTSVERQIPFYDPIPPTIIFQGEMYHAIPTGTRWEDPGIIAVDNVAGDLTDRVSVEGEVDCFRPGTYLINYTVFDTHDNRTTATRLVEVVAQPRPKVQMPQGKVIYLTFDDGPGPYTEQLLEVLAKYDVKATFFVTDTDYNHVMQKIVDQGHSIGIHSVTHNYEKIYSSPEAYFSDLHGMQDIIFRNTGVRTTLMRFPGGGSNLVSRRSNPGIMSLLTQAVQDAGYQYYDWNVDSEDAGGAKTARKVFQNVVAGVQSNRVSVVLQHDIHPYSVEAVEDIVKWGLDNGYTFLPLENTSPNFHHPVYN